MGDDEKGSDEKDQEDAEGEEDEEEQPPAKKAKKGEKTKNTASKMKQPEKKTGPKKVDTLLMFKTLKKTRRTKTTTAGHEGLPGPIKAAR